MHLSTRYLYRYRYSLSTRYSVEIIFSQQAGSVWSVAVTFRNTLVYFMYFMAWAKNWAFLSVDNLAF